MKILLTSARAAAALILVTACASGPAHAAPDLPKPATDLPAAKPGTTRTAVLAGGCFWCIEAVFEPLKGVSDVASGYAGGTKESASYEEVSAGKTGHAESVRITYDPAKISYGQLLLVYFTLHDPTTKDRAGPDHGHQYRSAIFYQDAEEQRVAAAYIRQLEAAKVYPAPIVTTLEPLDGFYPAEAYHQDFVRLHPDHPYVRQWSVPKVEKLNARFNELLAAPPAAAKKTN